MKLVLLGSTGFLGTAIIEAALKRSFSVTAIARDKKKLNNSIIKLRYMKPTILT